MTERPKPWFEQMDELRGARGEPGFKTQDDVAHEARSHGAPSTFTGSWISQLRDGDRPLSADILKGIAGALGVKPECFHEYLLAIARRELDEDEEDGVGLEQAVATLRWLEGLVDAQVAAAGTPDQPGGALEQILRSGSPSSTDQPQSDFRGQSRLDGRKRSA